MGLFSFLRKNKQEPASNEGEFSSRAEEDSKAVRNRGKRKQTGSSAPVDPVLPEKKRARRRLVGAIALVLAVVIGLPMILDSEPKPLADDIAIQIPSKDKPASSTAGERSASTASSSATSRVPASASLDKKEEVIDMPNPAAHAVPAETAKPTESRKPAETSKPSLAAGTTPVVVKPETKPEAKPVVKPEKPDTRIVMNHPERSDEAARAMAILEGKAESKADSDIEAKSAVDKKSEKFVVQVAALATQQKVNELQGKLQDAGIKSYTQKVATESGERIRIRIGPLSSKEDADKVRAKLGKIGLSGTVVPVGH